MGAPRQTLLARLKVLAQRSRSSAYFVKRGPIDWAVFDFDVHHRAISILHAHGTFLPPDGMHRSVIALEAAARFESGAPSPEIDDELQDELIEDLEEIVYLLQREKDERTDTVAYNLGGGSVRGFHDTGLHVQGVTAEFTVSY